MLLWKLITLGIDSNDERTHGRVEHTATVRIAGGIVNTVPAVCGALDTKGASRYSSYVALMVFASIHVPVDAPERLAYRGCVLYRLKKIPKATVIPVIGDSWRIIHDGYRLSVERFAKYGPVWETWVFGARTVVVGNADLVKWCLNQEHESVEGTSRHCLHEVISRHTPWASFL